MNEGEIVYTRDRSNGRVHKRARVGNGLATLEGDNLDAAGDFEVITGIELERVEADAMCRHCFPRPEAE